MESVLTFETVGDLELAFSGNQRLRVHLPSVHRGSLIHLTPWNGSFERVQRHAEDALAAGGCRRVRQDPDRGFSFDPAVLERVHQPMGVAREGTFGPVLALSMFRTEEKARGEASSTIHDLAAYVFTAGLLRAARVAEALDFGAVGVNDVRIEATQLPVGGIKPSGIGTENGKKGFAECLDTKSISAYSR